MTGKINNNEEANNLDKVPVAIIEIINKFLFKLSESNIRIEKAALFGSYAKGTYNEYSDIDIALFSGDFSGNAYWITN